MTLFVNMLIIVTRVLSFGPSGNNRFGFILFNDEPDEIVGIIAFIGNQALKIKVDDQGFGLGDVVALPSGQDKAERVAQAIDTDVNFGAEAASTAA